MGEFKSLKLSEKILLKTNPALLFAIFFILIVTLYTSINHRQINFAKANIFTLLWTYLAIVFIHTLNNLKIFKILNQNKKNRLIIKSYVQLTSLCLPYILIAVVYDNLVIFKRTSETIDLDLMKIDDLIFGVQPTIWLQKLLHPLAVEYFMVAYSLFFIYPFFYLIYLIQRNQLIVFQKVLLGEIIAVAISLCCYVYLPAMGPRVLLSPDHETIDKEIPKYNKPLEGIHLDFFEKITGKPSLYRLQADFNNFVERVKTDCMPSLHTGLCLLCLIFALKHRNIFQWKKISVYFWVIGVISLIISTVYLRYHWVIDVLAGAILAFALFWLSEKVVNSWIYYRNKKGLTDPDAVWLSEIRNLKDIS